MKSNKILSFFIIIILLAVCIVIAFLLRKNNTIEDPGGNEEPIIVDNNQDFDFKMIKQVNSDYTKQNYMISPLSIAYALSMVNDGASGNTKTEISNLLGNYKLNLNSTVKDKIGIANLIFIRNTYKNDISKDYIKKLQTDYDSDVMFDEFKTPDKVNKWVNDKTYGMIKDPVKDLSSEFVLGIANAIAVDVEWADKFKCTSTYKEEFTKDDNKKIDVAMMHSENDFTYIENDKAKGIIKDYAIYDKTTGEKVYEETDNTVSLEYIAILPNTSVYNYMKSFNRDELNSLLSNKKTSDNKTDLRLSLPKYTYDFDYEKFKEGLVALGMKDAFNPSSANFKGMLSDESDLELFISKAIHQSHIELSENGTKAAAVTIFIMEKNAMVMDKKEVIKIEFNKPFIYIIKEKNSDNIWFFGTVYEPMKWENNDSTNCKVD